MSIATAREHKILIAGQWRTTPESYEVKTPGAGVAGITYNAGEAEVEEAMQGAVRGFEAMKALPSYKRYDMLRGIADRIKDRKDEFARTMTLECGKPIKDSRVEVDRAVLTFTTSAEEAKRIPGEMLPLDLNTVSEGRFGIVQRFPVGPVLGITPFNFPLNLVAHKVGPALAAGNSIVVKPAPRTPLSSLLLAEVALESGVPPEAFSVVPTTNDLTRKMVADERFKAVSFTGGTDVGWGLRTLAGKKKVILELGGNAAVIVDDDADTDYAVSRSVPGAYGYMGQTCISVQRIYVHRSRYDEFVEKFIDLTKKLKIGDPMDETVSIGPVIGPEVAERIEQWVEDAVEHGATVLIGGNRHGQIYEPTLLANVNPSLDVSCAEVFGPVALVDTFDTIEEAIAKVNDSRYGLQAGIFSNNMQHVFKAFREIEVGELIVNDTSSYRIDPMPYGGVKDSGFGREGIRYTIEELTEMRLLVMNPR